MMTMEMVLELLGTLGDDVDVRVRADVVHVTVEDFEGFDDDWCEVDRIYNDDAVDAVYDALSDACDSEEGDYYHYFQFDGFTVKWGYASMDI